MDGKIADLDMSRARVIGRETLVAIRDEYWTRGGICCEEIFLSHEALRAVLADTVRAWLYEANQGDGIMEQHGPVLDAARAALGEPTAPASVK
jgi:hypothetical protein